MQQFNPIDAALLFLERTHTPFHVSFVGIYDPSTCPGDPPTFEDIVEAVRISLPAVGTFRRKIVRVPMDVDYPWWVEDEDFDLEFHMRHLALPKPGNRKQFRTQISRLISRPLDLSRPPWEMTVIEGLDAIDDLPPGCFATVLKVHHCAIDGKSGVALINLLHQTDPKGKPKRVRDDWQPEAVPGNRELLTKAWINSIRRPATIARLVLSNARGLVKAAYNDLRSDDEDEPLVAPETLLSGSVSAHRVMDTILWPLDDIKAVRHKVEGATVNDVCLAIVGQCMRNYLAARKALPEESLVTVMPISTRTPEQAEAGGNQIAIARVSLHTDILDPLERLAAIAQDTRAKKAMQEGVVMSVLLNVVHNLPGALVGAASRAMPLLSGSSTSISNTMLTNVPGSPVPLYMLGAQAVHMDGSPPLMDGGKLLHCVGSYNGQSIFSFTACRDGLPDPDFYKKCLIEAIKEVVAAAEKPPAKKARPKSRRR